MAWQSSTRGIRQNFYLRGGGGGREQECLVKIWKKIKIILFFQNFFFCQNMATLVHFSPKIFVPFTMDFFWLPQCCAKKKILISLGRCKKRKKAIIPRKI
jgi:hypothetical protein